MNDHSKLFKDAASDRVSRREHYLRTGAELAGPAFVLSYNVELGQETYRKLLLHRNGGCGETTCPTGLLLATPRWRIWQMTSGDDNHVYIGYDPDEIQKNKWYDACIKNLPWKLKLPSMKGDLVVFKKHDNIVWDELEWRREFLNFLVTKYIHKHSYIFSEYGH